MKVSVQAADVKAVLPAYSIDVAASRKEDLNQEPIVARLRKVRNISTYSVQRSFLFYRPAEQATMVFSRSWLISVIYVGVIRVRSFILPVLFSRMIPVALPHLSRLRSISLLVGLGITVMLQTTTSSR